MRNHLASRYVLGLLMLTAAPALADAPPIAPEEGLPVINWQDAGKYINQHVVLQGKIEATGRAKSITFLNFDDQRSFTAIIRKDNYANFPSPPDTMYRGKWVRIRGRITTFKGKPQIEIARPDQVTVLDGPADTTSRPAVRRPSQDGIVTVATYNILNLFDAHDDPYHDDEGTPPKPREQLEAVAATIRAIDADVLALQEVENRGYLQQFVRAMLGDMGYEHIVLFEGNDGRGIDCAVLSRLPVGPVTSYRHVRFSDDEGRPMRFFRDLIRVRIEPENALSFEVFVVHLKSKRGGSASDVARVAEARAVRRILDELLSADPAGRFVICGDFNDTWESASLRTICGEGPTALRSFADQLSSGTATYNKAPYRSMIDFMLCSPAMAQHYVDKSIQVLAGGISKSGSDHNPLLVRFDLRPQGKSPRVNGAAESTAAGDGA